MNIKEAKAQIREAMRAYFSCDEYGDSLIPVERQRPVFLMGPPGIGKTAIMEQIAQELGVGLVSYSMTHHTRQSALGLPYIVEKDYGGKQVTVTEYTMSEIIASVYDCMEETGLQQGILFLDEINCVSETLAPVMLQFLQYKVFGRHRVPDGWIIVTAGNPPEYNNSVREFDIVTWDRLKRIDVEPDYEAWKEYALEKGVHPAVLSYLDRKPGDFYRIETTEEGKTYVTARGWTDLADMLRVYERNGSTVDVHLTGQYLRNPKIAMDFAIFYDLFQKYRADYRIEKILAGEEDPAVYRQVAAAGFDERISLLRMLLESLQNRFRDVFRKGEVLRMIQEKAGRWELASNRAGFWTRERQMTEEMLQRGKGSGALTDDSRATLRQTLRILLEWEAASAEPSFSLQAELQKREEAFQKDVAACKQSLAHLFNFCDAAFPNGQELLIVVTELTAGFYSADFLSRYGSPEYFAHNQKLLFYERERELREEMEKIQ
ncbi:MAG: AAA family ATPase [Firmicutes bacterium]|nr:AAA family ATPase [Bacillota bacterium]